jgi:hypothetical protein
MRLRLVGEPQQDLAAATDTIERLVEEWGGDVRIEQASQGAPTPDHKGVDAIAVAALVLAVPSAVLAVVDLADRIRKRRRAMQLIEEARQVNVTYSVQVFIETAGGPLLVSDMDPDRLLELVPAEEDDWRGPTSASR